MEWWQIGLIILASIIAGAGVGYVVSHLFRRLSQRSFHPSELPVIEKVTPAPVPPATPVSPAPIVREQLTGEPVSDLATELKNNLEIATRPVAGRLIPFQSSAWDARQYEVDKLSATLRDDLEQLYTDIRLANSIVWVSTEFNRRTPTLDENYMRLRTSITERLNRIKLQIEQLEKSKTF